MAVDINELSGDLLGRLQTLLSQPPTRESVLDASQLCRVEWANVLDRVLLREFIDDTDLSKFSSLLDKCKRQLDALAATQDKAIIGAIRRVELYVEMVGVLMTQGTDALRKAHERAYAARCRS